MRLYFVLWESYWQGKGVVYLLPCFFVTVLISAFCRMKTDGLPLSASAAKTGGSSEGIKHPTTNWLRQSVPRPSKGGQWGLYRFFVMRQEAFCPPFEGRGTMRSVVVGCLGDTQSNDPRLEATS